MRTVVALLMVLVACVVARERRTRSPDAGPVRPRTLYKACKEDTATHCDSTSAMTPQGERCLQKHIEELTPLCREYHEGRMRCYKDARDQNPEKCMKNTVMCLRNIGVITPSDECQDSKFFKSITVGSHRRMLKGKNWQGRNDSP